MEIGEDHLPFANPRPLRLDGLLHLQHHLGSRPDTLGAGRDLRTRRAIRVVSKPRAEACALLDEHAVAIARERFRARGYERHAILRGLDLFRDADDHVAVPLGPSDTIVCRSGAKNSAASSDTSSAVSASTACNTSSRLRYGSL